MIDVFPERRFMPGVLFAEDFDEPAGISSAEPVSTGSVPVASEDRPRYSEVELGDAVAIAREEGIAAGRHDTLRGLEARRAELAREAVASLAAARSSALQAAETGCEQIAAATLTLLLGFLPCIADCLAVEQIRLIVRDFARSLIGDEPVTIAVHPDLLDCVVDAMPRQEAVGGAIDLRPDPTIRRGDFAARWRHGQASRDTAALRRRMQNALVEAGLLDAAFETTLTENRFDGH